ncbi:hypothetical protein BDB01DRAFT_792311 [Pilobolus umbonatus]|nr:hypothetical protein BDB01DRAFT_792311 [Pilobolus umbonatus]
MDHNDMDSQLTPFNISEPYANYLVTVIASVIALLTLRHVFIHIYRKTHLKIVVSYQRIENILINKFSYSAYHGYCPPLGYILLILLSISTILPILLLNVDLSINSNRAGFLALAIIPFLLSSTGKNPALSLLTGISAIKLNSFHRLLGMALFLCATIHMACMINTWSKFTLFLEEKLSTTKVHYGLAGYSILCLIVIGSAFPVRKYCYEFFLGSHLMAVVFIGVIAVHTPYAMRYFIAGLICYLLNLIAVWLVKSYVAQGRCEILPEGCTRITLRLTSPMANHHIGQYVYLCIPAVSPFQWHPFTITNVAAQPGNTLDRHLVQVYACVRGNYTKSLYHKVESSQELCVFVSGPFGSNSIDPHHILNTYSTIVIAAGGSGITFAMRLMRELSESVAYTSKKPLICKDIYFVWSVHHQRELDWFRKELEQIHYYFDYHYNFPTLHIKFHVTYHTHSIEEVTGAEEKTSSVTEIQEIENISTPEQSIECSTMKRIRNFPTKSIPTVYGERVQPSDYISVDNDQMGIYVCGPTGFNASFKNSVAITSLTRSSHIHLHCEEFSY